MWARTWIAAGAVLAIVGCGATVTPGPHDGATTDVYAWDSGLAHDGSRRDAVTADVSPADTSPADTAPPEDAIPIPSHCWNHDPTELITPAVLIEGQTFGLTAAARGMTFSCGASPLLGGRPDQLTWSLTACGGCDACDCIDPGYEVSTEVTGTLAGTYTVRVGATTRPLIVVPRDACAAITTWPADSLHVEVVGPDVSLIHDGPRLWWAHVTGTVLRCCAEPRITGTVGGIAPAGADLGLSLLECNPIDCECLGRPTPFESWIELGELSPGMHGMLISGTSLLVSFSVPGIR